MDQPKNFGFGEEEKMLRDSARKFFQDNFPADKLHSLVASNSDPLRELSVDWDKQLWQQLVDLGWTTLSVPESCGGMGMSLVAVTALIEEVGRAAFPSPLIATINATYLLAACKTEAANKVLAQIAEGKTVALATTDQFGSWDSQDCDVMAEGGVVDGTAYFVQDAQKVDLFIVKARCGDGIGLYVVDACAQGLGIKADAIVDLTRDQAQVKFSNVQAQEIAAPGQGHLALDQAEPALLAIQAADMCGAAEWQLQTTVEYAKVREQFGRAIGFFQAVKHPLVDLMVQIDRTRGLTYNAACAFDTESTKAEEFSRLANASACEMARFGSSKSVQLHGGIGFTWECYVHIYMKRQLHNIALLGDGAYHRAKLADIMLGEIA